MENESSLKKPEGDRENFEFGFAWHVLPFHIWETILLFLPISNLLRMKSVCKAWRSLIESQPFIAAYRLVSHNDLYFVLFADFVNRNVAAAYNPTEDKWVLISLSHISSSCPSTCCKLRRALISDGSLVVAEDRKGSIVVSNIFTRAYRVLPPMLPSIWPYALAVIEGNSSYQVVSVSTADRVFSQVYDSRTERWEEKGEFDGRFAMLGNAAYLDGFLFCLTHSPDKLLAFELERGRWNLVDVVMPPLVCSYIFVHQGALTLVGGVEELGVLKKIGFWELDRLAKQWHPICFMPDHLFYKFGNGNLNHFTTVDRCGKICFCRSMSSLVLMYDLSENRWWWLPPCPLGSCLKHEWFGQALEPRINVLV
ncbi:PREDICTED: F-box/kelch-repeat protein At5g15710-like [Nelumbo nucifera]|uniref:F-box domain-containing protein n=2 Tax=Nelumbo nucifera TaxID=4432 RepID=A0A822Z312_NELNU|nr:PREDICTED: F-box/kelch-repeat protein At5g15710-like [Nelumbo nucifera]DAD39167.1 TPA_asm: hypothetical protein HUJ06_013490 [Nelumbo nucifera]